MTWVLSAASRAWAARLMLTANPPKGIASTTATLATMATTFRLSSRESLEIDAESDDLSLPAMM